MAADALAAIQFGREDTVLLPEGMAAGAQYQRVPEEEFWVTSLTRHGLLKNFVLAMQARGVQLGPITALGYDATHWKDTELKVFLTRASAFRCRVIANDEPRGSGILVGPSSVLTAWHVIAVAAPGRPQLPAPRIEVQFADNRRIPAVARYFSPCGNGEFEDRLPESDDEILDRNDLALLSLREPAGLHLSFAALPSEPCHCRNGAAFMLVHYPEGEYEGIVSGQFVRLPTVTGRWGHNIPNTAGGSSGGGCFDTSFLLAGLHQGRRPGGGRLVPTVRFAEDIREHLARDAIPDSVWSLDGTVTGELVVGRETFFHAYAAASRGPARVRGIWIKRADPRKDVSGLPFTHRLLDRMVARSPGARLVTISFDRLVRDLPDEIARRVAKAGFPVQPVAAAPGVGATHTEPEAMVVDRSRRLAQVIDAAARAAGVRLWLFFEHPAILFGDEHRWALAAFVDQALRLDGLRLAMAGYEPVQLPGAIFASGAEAEGEGRPGLYVEYLAGFTRRNVEDLIRKAAEGLGRPVSDERVEELAELAVAGLKATNGIFFDAWMAEEVGRRLQPELGRLASGGAAP